MPTVDAVNNGEAVFLAHLGDIERAIAFVCARHHLTADDADEFGSHVKLKLVEGEYAILRKFEGRASLRTYLTIVIQRLFLDYRISAWGKWRPSAEAKRGGPVAVLLEQLTLRDGYRFEEACELLRARHGVTEDRAALERIAAKLPPRVRRRFEPDEALEDVPSSERAADDRAADEARQAMGERVSRALQTTTARLEAQDRLILALHFEDGRKIVEIASMLRIEQKALYPRVQRLLKAFRAELEAQGIDRAAVLDLLDSPDAGIDWASEAAIEKNQAGPSMEPGAQGWR